MNSSEKKKYNWAGFFAKPEVTMLLVLIGFCIVLAFSSDRFATSKNILNILRQIAVYAILGAGEALIIITGGIDLSVGSLIGWTACTGGVLSQLGFDPALVLLGILIAGLIPGIINGILVTFVGLPPFIATLGMLNIAYGCSLVITNGFPISYSGTWIHQVGRRLYRRSSHFCRCDAGRHRHILCHSKIYGFWT